MSALLLAIVVLLTVFIVLLIVKGGSPANTQLQTYARSEYTNAIKFILLVIIPRIIRVLSILTISSFSSLIRASRRLLIIAKVSGIMGNKVNNLNNLEAYKKTDIDRSISHSASEAFTLSIDKKIIRILAFYTIFLLIEFLSPTSTSWPLVSIPTIPIFFFLLIRSLTSYRIENEYYGNNNYEALELIRFIEANSDNPNFPNDPGSKTLRPRRAWKVRNFRKLNRRAGETT